MRLMLLQTTTTKSNAKLLIQTALEQGLSPCIQQKQIQSHYMWAEDSKPKKVISEEEILLNFKVFKKDFKKLKKLILKHHSYTLPEIVGIKLYKVSKPYKKWCKNAFKETMEQRVALVLE
ncbi:divalent cation tolerance protein CutA [Helicobacter turcicus]|uniref:Divalent-cation tolerance protein CutA n=1 Tax=Helicobacter turcicus TaxID=2867412 RepID=A0ABS7JKU5_9HELI|nr:divalent cation tolerance protein CutA [Helicobacter turcicus]MBX7490020.1 divalent-cation tolerance protein CutA [Helicobacter turcicus]MBX7544879.1 divalent-cation tolerance protein CutA [Helicobacter turcicus]